MTTIANGVPADSILGVQWHTSRFSGNNGTCVQVAALPGGGTAMRHSRDPGGPALVFSREEFTAFLDGAQAGEFDYLT